MSGIVNCAFVAPVIPHTCTTNVHRGTVHAPSLAVRRAKNAFSVRFHRWSARFAAELLTGHYTGDVTETVEGISCLSVPGPYKFVQRDTALFKVFDEGLRSSVFDLGGGRRAGGGGYNSVNFSPVCNL